MKLKNQFRIFLAVVMMAMFANPYCAWAQDTSGTCGEVTWAVSKSEGSEDYDVLTISGNGELADRSPWNAYSGKIKTAIIHKGVTAIGESVFKDCNNLVSISFEEGSQLTTIGNNAFENCWNLASITIPSSVTTIGEYVFKKCYDLALISFADGSKLTTIGNNTFRECSGLKSIIFPAGVTTIGNNAFEGCWNLPLITIPASVTIFGEYVFKSCSNLESISFEEDSKLTTIGNNTFCNISGLTSIIIPASVTTIGENAFKDCYNLASISFEEGTQLATIGNNAFETCYDLTSIIIPASVTAIGEYVFKGSSNLASISFAEGSKLTTIGNNTFCNLSGLTSFTIPASVTTLGEYVFKGCPNLESISFAEGSKLTTIGNKSTFYDISCLRSITIPASVTTIGQDVFKGCGNLASINFEEGSKLTTIGSNTFCNLTQLRSITIPAGVTTIGEYAFNGSYNLASIYFEEGSMLTTIGNNAFYKLNQLKSITIPASVTTIGENAFKDCYNLASISFEEDSQLATIGNNAFGGCYSGLTSITIPASVTTIGENAFKDCSNLASISFEEGSQLTTIGSNSFSKISALTSIIIPASVTTIGENAFNNCPNLALISFEEGSKLATIGNNAFEGCLALTSITIPACVTTIGQDAFKSYKVEHVYVNIPDGKVLSVTIDGVADPVVITPTNGKVDIFDCILDAQNRALKLIIPSSYTLSLPESVTLTQNTESKAVAVKVTNLELKENADGKTPKFLRVLFNAGTLVNQAEANETIPFQLSNDLVPTSYDNKKQLDWKQDKNGTERTIYVYVSNANWNAAAPGTYTGTISYRAWWVHTDNTSSGDIETGAIPVTVTISKHTISATASPAEGGTVTGGGYYDNGSNVTLTATPNKYYKFANWTEGNTVVSTDATYIFTATADRTLTANFAPDVSSYTLSLPESVTLTPNTEFTTMRVDVSKLELKENTDGKTPDRLRLILQGGTLMNQKDNSKTIPFKLNVSAGTSGMSDTKMNSWAVANNPLNFYICISGTDWNAAVPGTYTGSIKYITRWRYGTSWSGDIETGYIPVTVTILESLTVDESSSAANVIDLTDGTKVKLTYIRTLSAPSGSGDKTIDGQAARLVTTCLPHAPKTATGIKYYTLKRVSGQTLYFDEVITPAAETPYLVAVFSGSIDEGTTNTEVTLKKVVSASSSAGGYTLRGTLTGLTNAEAAGKYILQPGGKWGKVPSGNAGVYIPPFRAYIEGPAAARELGSSLGDDDATGIDSIMTTDADGTERWYDLNGRRISKPTRKGIYIHNGKKTTK